MKNTMKVFLVIALFCSVGFADGDMGAGGRTCPAGQSCFTNPDTTVNNDTNTESGIAVANDTEGTENDESLIESIRTYLDLLFF